FVLVAMAVAVLVPRDFYTGTDSVRSRSYPAELGPGQVLCTAEQRGPAGTGRIQLEVNTGPRPPLSMELRLRGERPIRVARPLQGPTTGVAKIDFAIPRRPSSPESTPGTICVRSSGDHVFFGGVPGLSPGDQPAVAVGRPLAARIAVWFRPPVGEKRSVASLAPDIIRRVSLFRPGFVGPWTYVAILALLMPALLYGGVRLMATAAAGEPRRRRLGLAGTVALLAFLNAVAWSLITPAFNAPDETEHFAYGQYLAEVHRAPFSRVLPPYSTDAARGVDAVRLGTSDERGDGKPPWLPEVEQAWRAAGRRPGAQRQNDGGGQSTATAPHSPLYYSLLAPAYALSSSGSVFDQLWAMRLMSALMGALVAACAVLIARELVPRRPLLAAAAGLLVAFEPMFGFMSGAVNNDSGVNAAAAVLVYLLVRGLMRGLTVRLALAIGVALIVLPLMKGTGFALYPAALVAVAGMLWRLRRERRWVRPGVAFAGTTGGAFLAWLLVSSAFHRGAVTTPGGQAPGLGSPGVEHPIEFASYLWQVFLPKLSFMTDWWPSYSWPFFDLWIVRGFGAFGWYAMTFPDWVYWVITAVVLLVAACAVAVLVRRRDAVRRLAWPLIVLALVIGGVIVGVHSYYLNLRPHVGFIPEQGRYAFPAITAFATVAVGSLLVLSRRWVVPAVAGLATAMLGLDWAAQMLALTRFYS
ncbi:MAG: hypothetical protein QOD53_2025, partial [Thermoleophilaceae bacterium]|nr:hypothetical protein [Thermoleophilaceae bacterium]